eukprot:697795-Rhodomonas_salina.3
MCIRDRRPKTAAGRGGYLSGLANELGHGDDAVERRVQLVRQRWCRSVVHNVSTRHCVAVHFASTGLCVVPVWSVSAGHSADRLRQYRTSRRQVAGFTRQKLVLSALRYDLVAAYAISVPVRA